MEIKDKITTTMDEPVAMQEDGDNWNQEEMVDAAIGLITLDSDLHLWFISGKNNFRKKVEYFTWNEHRQKFYAYNDQFNYGK